MPKLLTYPLGFHLESVCASNNEAQEDSVTIDDLKIKVANYISFMESKGLDRKDIFVAASISKETIQAILSPDTCNGVRIYMALDPALLDKGAFGITFLMVPVDGVGTGGDIHDLISDDDPVMRNNLVSDFTCRCPPCNLPCNGSVLI